MHVLPQGAASHEAHAPSLGVPLRTDRRHSRWGIWLGAASLLLAFSGCGKSSNPVAPPPPSGGKLLSGSLGSQGSQYSYTFNQPGSYSYYCTIHPSCAGLAGTVVVVGSGAPIRPQNHSLGISITGGSAGGPYGGGSCSALSMSVDSVRVNETVTWTNDSTLPHNVTSR